MRNGCESKTGRQYADRSTERKRFFLKKEAKTLVRWRARRGTVNALIIKSFLALFCKKELLYFLAFSSCQA
jgi:hypothetical protein